MAAEPFIGEIRLFGFSFAPNSWALAQGQLYSTSQYSALFALYGTSFGGNGQTTFAIPDLRGRIPIGQGQRTGGAGYAMGTVAGSEKASLQLNNMPTHNHTFTGTLNALENKATLQAPEAGAQLARSLDQNGTDTPLIYVPAGTSGIQFGLGGVNGTTGVTGGSDAFSTLSPVVGLNYSVALNGIFPSRN